MVIGEDLQKQCTAYYGKEYYLSLEKVAARMGHFLSCYDALARLKAQDAIITGMAQGIINVQPAGDAALTGTAHHRDESPTNDELSDLEEHPF